MRALALVVLLSLLAGCAALPGATREPAASPAPDVKAADASITTVGDTTFASWSGDLAPRAGDPATGQPLPGSATPTAQHKISIPSSVTLMVGWLNWSGDAAMTMRVVNDTGRSMCGESFATTAPAMCFLTFYLPRNGTLDWTALAQLNDAKASVSYQWTMAFSSRALPILGSPAPYGSGAAMQFAPPVVVDHDRHTGEPSIAVTPKGTVYVAAPTGAQQSLWRSTDGKSFTYVPIHGDATNDPLSSYPVGGGDSDVAISGDSTVYFADQQGGSGETVSSSHDAGKSWFTQPLGAGPAAVPGSPVPLPVPVPVGAPTGLAYSADRQWLVTDGDMTAWMAFNSAQGATVVKTLDGGRSWPVRAYMMEDACFRGNLARAKDGTLYYAGCNEKGPGVGVSTDGGLTFTWHLVAQRDGKTNTSFLFPAHIFVVATTDSKGNAYVVWSDEAQTPDATGAPADGCARGAGRADGASASSSPPGDCGLNVWMSSSTDKGASWSKPKKVNQEPGTFVEPWATGGADGRLAIAYYGTKYEGNPERALGEWYPIVAFADDATSDAPSWHASAISPDLVQYGPICMRGSACGGARNLLDFFQMQGDSSGHLHVAYVDGRAGINARLSTIMYAEQSGGATMGGPSVDKTG